MATKHRKATSGARRSAITRWLVIFGFAVALVVVFYFSRQVFYQINNRGKKIGLLYYKVTVKIDPEENIEALTKINTRKSDEALVDLLDYYNGEHPDEEIAEALIERGQRVRPLLIDKLKTTGVRQSYKESRDNLIKFIIEEIDKKH